MTKSELAERLGVSRAYITMLSNGKRKITNELTAKIQMMLVNNEVTLSDLKSASLTGVWVQVPPSAPPHCQSSQPDRFVFSYVFQELHVHPGAQLVPVPVRRDELALEPDPVLLHMYEHVAVGLRLA